MNQYFRNYRGSFILMKAEDPTPPAAIGAAMITKNGSG